MRRLFSSPLVPLAVGLCFRLLFVLKFPAGSGDTGIYEELATNWLKHGIYGMQIADRVVPVDLRVPGYPAFLALLYAISGRSGESARLLVMLVQVAIDLGSCVLVGVLAAWLANRCAGRFRGKAAFTAGLWLAACCPFTANYTAVPLTEVWAIFLTAAAMCLLLPILDLVDETKGEWTEGKQRTLLLQAALAGATIGVGTLFRPEAPLLLIVFLPVLAVRFLTRGLFRQFWAAAGILCVACALPLVPWAIRNAVMLHEFQPLAPKEANLPGEYVPKGFLAWEKTWLYRVRDCYLVPWKLNEEEINIDDIPASAFDSPEEKERIAAALEKYNDDLTLNAEEDAEFAAVARERTARHPLRTYVSIPVRRAGRIWFTPRIELLPVSGNVFPLAYMNEEDPVDQRVTILFFVLNIVYVLSGLVAIGALWKCPAARVPIAFLVLFILMRTAFLTTVETPEPRYVLVCFPPLLAMIACLFGKRRGALAD